jgi:hypothetical protein
MEIVIKGEGETTIALFDRSGRALLRKQWRVSGHPRIEARSRLPLVLQTTRGEAAIVPVLVRSGSEQQVTFDGKQPRSVTEDRYRMLKWPRTAVEKISRATTQLGESDERFPNVVQTGRPKR